MQGSGRQFSLLVPLLIMPILAMLVCAGRGPQAMLAAMATSDVRSGLGFAMLIGLSAAAINYKLAANQQVPANLTAWPTGLPCLMIGTSVLILWGPIGLLAKGLALQGPTRWLALLGLLVAHLCVTYPYVVQAALAGRPRVCIRPTLAQSLGEFSVTLMVCGNPHLDSRHAPFFIYSYYDPARMPAVHAVCALLSLLSLCLFASLMAPTSNPGCLPPDTISEKSGPA